MATRKSRFMSLVQTGRPGRRRMPARSAATQTSASWATPAKGMAQTSHSIISPPMALPVTMAIITKMLSSTGAAAAAAKWPVAFSAPEKSAASEMKKI